LKNNIEKVEKEQQFLLQAIAEIKEKMVENRHEFYALKFELAALSSAVAELKDVVKKEEKDFRKYRDTQSKKKEELYRSLLIKIISVFIAFASTIVTIAKYLYEKER